VNDREIRLRRAELHERRLSIQSQWQQYDREHPVLPGAYKPADYDSRQREFLTRLREVGEEYSALGRTKAETLRTVLIWAAVLAAAIALLRRCWA
jgi:hypothetical protein